MNIFDDKHVLLLVFLVLGAFIAITLLLILMADGVEATILPALALPALVLFMYLLVRKVEKEQQEYKGIASGIWSGFWFTEFAFILALALSAYVILTSNFIKSTFFEDEGQTEIIENAAEYRPNFKND